MTLAEFWPQCLRLLYTQLNEQQFQMAIAPLTVGEEDGAWVVYAKNQFAANLLRTQYLAQLDGARASLAPQASPLQIKVGKGIRFMMAAAETVQNNKRQAALLPAEPSLSGSLKVAAKPA
ncbi:MAG: DnaA N-terminal domain-containing protein, partial [Conchiformibius sp.]|nr:DnaA N-terminal domain-containing protein [Conchiformibius sp.]